MISPETRHRLRLFLEHFDSWITSAIQYILFVVLAFGVAAALFSITSGGLSVNLLTTQEGTNIMVGIVVIALLILWREVREIRVWLAGISRGHSKRIYSRLGK
jgi:type IV secretory pathway VirB6-like protein